MCITVGIVGSRDFAQFERVERFMDSLSRTHPDAQVLTGRATPLERRAALAARGRGLFVRQLDARWARDHDGAIYRRNEEIAARAGVLVAFLDGPPAGALAHAIAEARRAGTPVVTSRAAPLPLVPDKRLPAPACLSSLEQDLAAHEARRQREQRARIAPARRTPRPWWDRELGESSEQAPAFRTDDLEPEVLEGEEQRWAEEQLAAAERAESRARMDAAADRELGPGVSLDPLAAYEQGYRAMRRAERASARRSA